MRSRIHAIVLKAAQEDRISRFYDILICLITVFSLSPLMFRNPSPLILKIDTVTMYALFLDYLLRWITCDMDAGQRGHLLPFFLFPFRPLSILALLGILPSLGILNQGWKILRILRISSLMYYSSQLELIRHVFQRQRQQLLIVLGLTVSYVYLVALVVFNAEPDAFPAFFDAVSWSTTTLTSIVYQSTTLETPLTQGISILSSLVGIGIIALPTGIITSGFMEAVNERITAGQSEIPPAEHSLASRPLNRNMVLHYLIGMLLFSLLNIAGYHLATALQLPLWLDTIGTMAAAILLEPTAALLVGFVNNLVMAISYGNFAIVYYSISAITALAAGLLLKKQKKILYRRFLPVMLLISTAASFLSFCINVILTHANVTALEAALNIWECQLYTRLCSRGISPLPATLYALTAVKFLDMAACFLLLTAICLAADTYRRKNGPSLLSR